MVLTKTEFIEFLKKKDIYNEFKNNTESGYVQESKSLDDYFKKIWVNSDTNSCDAVLCAFRWDDTPERWDFWDKIDTEWYFKSFNKKRT